MFNSSNKWLAVRLALAAGVCVLGGGSYFAHAQSSTTPLSLQAQAGQKLFFDTNLSASKKMSCATCHDPNNHYAPSNAQPVQFGGPNLTTPGFRAVPTLTYKDLIPPYSDDAVNPDGVARTRPAAASPGTAVPTLWRSRWRSRCCLPSRWPTPARPQWSR